MFSRLLVLTCLLFSISYGNKDAKFLVVDANAYEKIEVLKILNGGIKKEYVISSKSLSKDSLKRYYPEYFLFDGPICFNINNITIDKKSDKDITILKNEHKIKKEVKKIKLLQMLNESKFENVGLSQINDIIIKSVGVLCEDNLFLRGKVYSKNSKIGKYQIKSINVKNTSIHLEENK
jgi:hypothetical protein